MSVPDPRLQQPQQTGQNPLSSFPFIAEKKRTIDDADGAGAKASFSQVKDQSGLTLNVKDNRNRALLQDAPHSYDERTVTDPFVAEQKRKIDDPDDADGAGAKANIPQGKDSFGVALNAKFTQERAERDETASLARATQVRLDAELHLHDEKMVAEKPLRVGMSRRESNISAVFSRGVIQSGTVSIAFVISSKAVYANNRHFASAQQGRPAPAKPSNAASPSAAFVRGKETTISSSSSPFVREQEKKIDLGSAFVPQQEKTISSPSGPFFKAQERKLDLGPAFTPQKPTPMAEPASPFAEEQKRKFDDPDDGGGGVKDLSAFNLKFDQVQKARQKMDLARYNKDSLASKEAGAELGRLNGVVPGVIRDDDLTVELDGGPAGPPQKPPATQRHGNPDFKREASGEVSFREATIVSHHRSGLGNENTRNHGMSASGFDSYGGTTNNGMEADNDSNHEGFAIGQGLMLCEGEKGECLSVSNVATKKPESVALTYRVRMGGASQGLPATPQQDRPPRKVRAKVSRAARRRMGVVKAMKKGFTADHLKDVFSQGGTRQDVLKMMKVSYGAARNGAAMTLSVNGR